MKFQVDRKGYAEERKKIFSKYLSHSKIAYIPRTEDYEAQLLLLMLRSNHHLTKRSDWYWGSRVLTRYTFVHTQVITEVIGGKDYVVLGLPATIAKSFRKLVISHMLSLRRELRPLVRKASSLEELYIISQSLAK